MSMSEIEAAAEATRTNQHTCPLVKPATTIGEALAEPVKPPGLEVATKPLVITASPPLNAAEKVMVACAFPRTAETPVGAEGTVAGVTEEEAPDATELPMTFVQ
jgi:hypothetical protein